MKEIRNEEPQSHRDLAIALYRRQSKSDLEYAISLLKHIIENDWDIR